MKESVRMALQYTCPTLDQMAKEYAWRFTDHKEEKEFLAFIEEIKKQITCPMRTALEQVCEKLVKTTEALETELYDKAINHE